MKTTHPTNDVKRIFFGGLCILAGVLWSIVVLSDLLRRDLNIRHLWTLLSIGIVWKGYCALDDFLEHCRVFLIRRVLEEKDVYRHD